MVRQLREEVALPPPLQMQDLVSAGQSGVEHQEGMGVARAPAVRLLFQDERSTPAALTFLSYPCLTGCSRWARRHKLGLSHHSKGEAELTTSHSGGIACWARVRKTKLRKAISLAPRRRRKERTRW